MSATSTTGKAACLLNDLFILNRKENSTCQRLSDPSLKGSTP